MKYLHLMIFVLLAIAALIFYIKPAGNSPIPTNTPPAVVDETENLKIEIKKALIEKHGEEAKKLEISVMEINGNYAKGGASEEGLGGGVWFAAKKGEKWNLVWDGNGIITCIELKDYAEFPSSLIPQCFDAEAEVMVKR